MSKSVSKRLRKICLALPEASEKEAWQHPTYRVGGKMFAMEAGPHSDPALWAKAPPGSQLHLVTADPGRFFVPPYMGPKGWVGMRLKPAPDWNEVAVLVERAYRLTAPKKLLKRLDED